MNGPIFRYAWRSQRVKLAVVSLALVTWGFLMPVVYARFGAQFKTLMDSGMLPQQFVRFGGQYWEPFGEVMRDPQTK